MPQSPDSAPVWLERKVKPKNDERTPISEDLSRIVPSFLQDRIRIEERKGGLVVAEHTIKENPDSVTTKPERPVWLDRKVTAPPEETIEQADSPPEEKRKLFDFSSYELEFPEVIEPPSGESLSGRFLSALTLTAIDFSGIENIAAQGPMALQPDVLKGQPQSLQFERAFGLERTPEQVAYMLLTPNERQRLNEIGLGTKRPTRKITEEDTKALAQIQARARSHILHSRGDLVKLAERQEEVRAVWQNSLRTVLGAETPPEGILETAIETAGHLTGFMTRLAVLNRVTGLQYAKIPPVLRGMVTWEIEGQLARKPPGEGAAMAFGLESIEALPIPRYAKMSIEAVGFAVLAAAYGGDEMDIYVAASIPFAFGGARAASGALERISGPGRKNLQPQKQALAQKLREARSLDELKEVAEAVHDLAVRTRREYKFPEDYQPSREELNNQVRKYMESLSETDRVKRAHAAREFRQRLMKKAAESEKFRTEIEPILRDMPDKYLADTAKAVGPDGSILVRGKNVKGEWLFAEIQRRETGSRPVVVDKPEGKKRKQTVVVPPSARKFIGQGKLPGTELVVGDVVSVGKGKSKLEWTVIGGRLGPHGEMRVFIERSVPDKEGGRKGQRRWARADRLRVVRPVSVEEAPFTLPEPTTEGGVGIKPKDRGSLLYNLHNPRAFIVSVVGKDGAAQWMLRRPDGARVRVNQELVQGLIDEGVIVKLGKGIWGIPEDKIHIKRTWRLTQQQEGAGTTELVATEPEGRTIEQVDAEGKTLVKQIRELDTQMNKDREAPKEDTEAQKRLKVSRMRRGKLRKQLEKLVAERKKIVEVIEGRVLPQPKKPKGKKPKSETKPKPQVSKVESAKRVAQTVSSLQRENDFLDRKMQKLEELQGAKDPDVPMTGMEQAQVLGPNLPGPRRTFGEARVYLVRRQIEVRQRLDKLAKIEPPVTKGEPKPKPGSLEHERSIHEYRLQLLEEYRFITKDPSSETMTPFQQWVILGGSTETPRTFAEAESMIRARIDAINEQIKLHSQKAKKKEKPSKVLSRVGPEEEPVTSKEEPRKKRLNTGRTRPWVIQSPEQFKEMFDRGLLVIPKKVWEGARSHHWRDILNFLVQDGRVKIVERPKATAERKKAQARAKLESKDKPSAFARGPRVRSLDVIEDLLASQGPSVRSQLFGGKELASEELAALSEGGSRTLRQTEVVVEGRGVTRSPEQRELLAKLVDAVQLLPEHQQIAIDKYFGWRGEKQTPPEKIAEELGISVNELIGKADGEPGILDNAILNIRKAAGVEPPNATVQSSFRRHNPYQFRRGMIDLYPLVRLAEFATVPFRYMGRFILIESRWMVEQMRYHGRSREVDNVANYFDRTIDTQNEYLGSFQKEQNATQKRLNRHSKKAAWDVQHRPFTDGGIKLEKTNSGMIPVSSRNWTVDRLQDLVEGRIEPKNDGERVIVESARKANQSTGELFESPEVDLQIEVAPGKFIKFRKAPGGRTFPAMPTIEHYDILFRGPKAGDGLWEAMVDGYYYLNRHKKIRRGGKERGLTKQDVHDKFIELREMVTEQNPSAGYRHVGAELSRFFERRPTALRSTEGFTRGRRVQIMVTEPREYIDQVYLTSAIRAGFIRHFGQGGELVARLRRDYLKGATGDSWPFDNTIRAMSDIPPLLTGTGGYIRRPSPASVEYNAGRATAATIEVIKQFLLTATAFIQTSESIAIAVEGGTRRFVRGVGRMAREGLDPRTHKDMRDDLIRHRAITIDVVSYMWNRAHGFTDFLNKFAAILSRLHLNKIANELFNEHPAGAQAWMMIREMVMRGASGRAPRPQDVQYLHASLRFPLKTAERIASGKGSSEENYAAMRRASQYATATIGLRSERSPLRNLRTYRRAFPFTNFFSNRIRMFSLHSENVWKTHRAHAKAIGTKNEKAARKEALYADYRMARFLVGTGLAGVVGSYIFAMLREGPIEGLKSRTREAVDDPLEFIIDAFVWGSFGPVYGAFYESFARGASSPEEPPEMLLMRLSRASMPFSIAVDTYKALRGIGPYKHRSGSERLSRFIQVHIPVLQTLPGQRAAEFLGVQMEDPKTTAALKAYSKWLYDPKNRVVPPHGGHPGTQNRRIKEITLIHLRRAREAELRGGDPWPHIAKAFDSEDGAIDIEGRIGSYTLLDGLNDEEQARLEKHIGSEKMRILRDRDLMIRLLAYQAGRVYGRGTRLLEQKRESERVISESQTVRPRRRR